MSVVIKVDREINYGGRALHDRNVQGPLFEAKKKLSDDFTNITLDSNMWATSVPGSSDTIAISEVAGGECLITTGTADDDSCMLASSIIYNGTKNAIVEVRVTIDDVSGTALFVGFTDAKSESNNSIALHYPADSFTSVASDAAGFVIDADHATSSIMLASVKADADTTPVDTTVDWLDGETRNLRVEIDTSGNAAFYIDGLPVGRIASAVTTATLLCVGVHAMTRANDGANTIQVRKVNTWVDET